MEARRLKSPLDNTEAHLHAGKSLYDASCAGCHGEDGKARTKLAGSLPVRPTDLSDYLMESMKEGEIYWVIRYGIDKMPQSARPPDEAPPRDAVLNGIQARVDQSMPSFEKALDETQRWEVVRYVRELRRRQKAAEVSELGPYQWDLPPGFPYPNVPGDNPMTEQKVALGRYLFYDRRLSLNQTQSCSTCHQQQRAFTDGRGRGLGSTGQLHPRGPMSLVNVAYSPVLTWANPNIRSLETQALVPIFGDEPVELGLSGMESILLNRLKTQTLYRHLFAAAYPDQAYPFTVANVTKAIASFERTILSGDSPYDRYRRGDDPNAISASAKRGESLFFGERLECFHCHGGFNFTGTVDYYGKGFGEVEFHNTGLYNTKGKFSYPEPNLGLYTFTQAPDDVGKFKAPTLRNIAVTAPYMHDGSVKTLAQVVEHYAMGGRTIPAGPNAGVGSENPNKSEFVKPIALSPQDKEDVLAFLRSLTDERLLTNPALSDPFRPASVTTKTSPRTLLRGVVAKVYPADGAIALYHNEVPGLLAAMKPPFKMEFIVPDRKCLATLKERQSIVGFVRRQGSDWVLDDIQPTNAERKRP
jgi:cytochrome c peroxidase